MLARLKYPVFIDTLYLQLSSLPGNIFRGVLKDDRGRICSTVEKDISDEREEFTWTGLNDLPYGRYTLEITHGPEEFKVHVVKRV